MAKKVSIYSKATGKKVIVPSDVANTMLGTGNYSTAPYSAQQQAQFEAEVTKGRERTPRPRSARKESIQPTDKPSLFNPFSWIPTSQNAPQRQEKSAPQVKPATSTTAPSTPNLTTDSTTTIKADSIKQQQQVAAPQVDIPEASSPQLQGGKQGEEENPFTGVVQQVASLIKTPEKELAERALDGGMAVMEAAASEKDRRDNSVQHALDVRALMAKKYPRQMAALEKAQKAGNKKEEARLAVQLSGYYRAMFPALGKQSQYDPFLNTWYSANPMQRIDSMLKQKQQPHFPGLPTVLSDSFAEPTLPQLQTKTEQMPTPADGAELLGITPKSTSKLSDDQEKKKAAQQAASQPWIADAWSEARAGYDKEKFTIGQIGQAAGGGGANGDGTALGMVLYNESLYQKAMDPDRLLKSIQNRIPQSEIERIANEAISEYRSNRKHPTTYGERKAVEAAYGKYIEDVIYPALIQYGKLQTKKGMNGYDDTINWLAYFRQNLSPFMIQRGLRRLSGGNGNIYQDLVVEDWVNENPWAATSASVSAILTDVIATRGASAGGRVSASIMAKAAPKLFGTTARGVRAGRVATQLAAAGGNFSTFNLEYGVLNQFATGEWDMGALAEEYGKGWGLGIATGGSGMLVSRATNSATAAVARRGAGLKTQVATKAVGHTLGLGAEVTTFAVGDMVFDDKSAGEAFGDAARMVTMFKVAGAPKSIAHGTMQLSHDSRYTTLQQGERSWWTRAAERYTATPGLDFTPAEKRELKDAGYWDIVPFTSGLKDNKQSRYFDTGKTDKSGNPLQAEQKDTPEPHLTDRMAQMLSDGNISWSARMKLAYVLTGKQIPMPMTHSGRVRELEDGYAVEALDRNGTVISRRDFRSEKAAQKALEDINHQANVHNILGAEQRHEADNHAIRFQRALQRVAEKYQQLDPASAPQSEADVNQKPISASTVLRVYNDAVGKQMGGEELSTAERSLINAVKREMDADAQHSDAQQPITQTAEELRTLVREETGIDVDKAISKHADKRSDVETEAIDRYIDYLTRSSRSSRAVWAAEKVLEQTGIDIRNTQAAQQQKPKLTEALKLFQEYLKDAPAPLTDELTGWHIAPELRQIYQRGVYAADKAECEAIDAEYLDAMRDYDTVFGDSFNQEHDGSLASAPEWMPYNHAMSVLIEAGAPEQVLQVMHRAYAAHALRHGMLAGLQHRERASILLHLAEIEAITHADGQTIRPVNMKDGSSGYIVEGDFETIQSEGKVIPNPVEDAAVVIARENGEREQVSTKEIDEVLPQIDAEAERQQIIDQLNYEPEQPQHPVGSADRDGASPFSGQDTGAAAALHNHALSLDPEQSVGFARLSDGTEIFIHQFDGENYIYSTLDEINYYRDNRDSREELITHEATADRLEQQVTAFHPESQEGLDQPIPDTQSPLAGDSASPFSGEEKTTAQPGIVGRSLNAEEAETVIHRMEDTAEQAAEIPLTPEAWVEQFGEEGKVETPIGTVKMGENQYFKLAQQGREGKLGMIRPTLENPTLIIEDERPATDQSSERATAYIFVRTFAKSDGSRYYHFTSVTVSRDGYEVVISNQEKTAKRISKLLQNGKVAWINNEFSLHPKSQIEESVPLNETNKPTNTDNQPASLGINSSEHEQFLNSEGYLIEPQTEGSDLVPTPNHVTSDGKVNNSVSEKQMSVYSQQATAKLQF